MEFSNILSKECPVLVNELIPPEIIPLVWFSCIAVTVYVFFRVFSSTLKEKFRDLINNAPRILNEINKTIAEQKAQGVSDEQMKGIFQKKQMLELVTNNAEVINIIGKPIIKKLLGFVKAI